MWWWRADGAAHVAVHALERLWGMFARERRRGRHVGANPQAARANGAARGFGASKQRGVGADARAARASGAARGFGATWGQHAGANPRAARVDAAARGFGVTWGRGGGAGARAARASGAALSPTTPKARCVEARQRSQIERWDSSTQPAARHGAVRASPRHLRRASASAPRDALQPHGQPA